MGKLFFGSGSVRLEMDDALDRIYRNAIETVAPGMLARIETATKEIFDAALKAWPRKTGRSADGLRMEIVVAGDNSEVRGTITDPVTYAKYIKAKSLGGKSAFVEILRKPLQKRAKELVGELGGLAKTKLLEG